MNLNSSLNSSPSTDKLCDSISGGRIIESRFKPWFALQNQHLQTIWPALFRPTPQVETSRERLITPDLDFLDLDWLERPHQPLIILIHGLASSSKAKYIRGLQRALFKRGYASVALNLRGCSGEPNLKIESYHGGVSKDLGFVVDTLRTRFPDRPLGAIGFSLGANILLKWLAETTSSAHLFGAAAVSAPLQLNLATERLQQGFSKIYEQYLLAFMKSTYEEKMRSFEQKTLTTELEKLKALRSLKTIKTIADFDEFLTAPVHGFDSAKHYYQRCSTRPLLKKIDTPTLIVHAKDDPFMPPEILPQPQELSPHVLVEVSEKGGHVVFVGSNPFGRPFFWLEKRLPDFLDQVLGATSYQKPSLALFEYPHLSF